MQYSSREFGRDWRYAVEQEFTTGDESPFPYAPDGHQSWGNEVANIPLQDASKGCVSADGKYIAIAVGKDVHVFSTQTHEAVAVLRGHLTEVSGVAFQPNNSNMLLSSSSELVKRAGGKLVVEAQAAIILWRLDEQNVVAAQRSDAVQSIAKAASDAAIAKLAETGTTLMQSEVAELEELFTPGIQHVVTKHVTASKISIHGTLLTSFGSNTFSPSGRFMVYVPGNRPRSNDVVEWDMCICRTDDLATPVLKLSGHTDAIMWAGWNQDETLFASVAWDSTVRIWDAASGEAVRIFRTGDRCQNWTGEFSPNSKYFVATDGTSRVHVYDISSIASSAHGSADNSEAYWVYLGMKEYDGWRRTVSWHPNSKWLAVGKDQGYELIVLDVEEKKLLQKRTLSTAAMQVDREELRSMVARYPGATHVQFADKGKKVVVWTQGDDSIEVFDVAKEQKWRFGRGGTEDVPGAEAWRDDNGKLTSPYGLGMLVWESDSKLQMASLDGDAIRFWAIHIE
ncbi:hypothetical protein NLG97_g2949 [Lecanicillium saksenae]|uniref:Uncharacterized protein n=1 Tax=Lecanicillium saksenae TaxID=468837 RepID=A0ACC1R246_9HYPO|nr:hypothetical protein NLG97_g2949 [Lecanicillium saksenae]